MGNIGDELFLIVFRPGNGVSHVTQRSGQIAEFVLPFNRNVIMHISQRILLGSGDDMFERTIYIFSEK